MMCTLSKCWPNSLVGPCDGDLRSLDEYSFSPASHLSNISSFHKKGENPEHMWQVWLTSITASTLSVEEIQNFTVCDIHKDYLVQRFSTKTIRNLRVCSICSSKSGLRNVNYQQHKECFKKFASIVQIGAGLCMTCRVKLSVPSEKSKEMEDKLPSSEECPVQTSVRNERKRTVGPISDDFSDLKRSRSETSESNHGSQLSKCSEASIEQEDRQQKTMTTLMQTLVYMAGDDIDLKMQKPLPKDATRKQKTDAKKDMAKILKIVLQTVQPEGTVEENLKLATVSLDELRKTIGGDEIVDDGLKNLISQYKCVENRVIKRALLGEIAKRLSYTSVLRLVDASVSRYEFNQSKRRVVFGSKKRHQMPKTKQLIRDVDIAHFTNYVLSKHTRDMAWGVKTMKFKSGSKVKIGNVVLEALQSQIIRDYISATEDHNKSCCPEGLIRIFSSSTYRRWLKAVKWTKSKALAGLDSYAATGFDALDTLGNIISELKANDKTKTELKDKLTDLRRFLKFDFKKSIEDGGSGCGWHCETFGLSEGKTRCRSHSVDKTTKGASNRKRETSLPSNSTQNVSRNRVMKTDDFSEKCSCTGHTSICSGCSNQEETFGQIQEILSAMGDKWLLHKFGLAIKDVADYKKHLLRAIHQDRSKTDIMDSLSPQTAMIIFDFAMKFLPVKYREAQRDFFGKKGLSWHVMVALWKTEDGTVNVKTMVYLLGNVKQDWFVGLSTLESFVKYLKTTELPDLKVVHARCDNAGNYHNGALILGLQALYKQTGVLIQSLNTSEPGYGKDICDRKIAVLRSHIREFQMKREDVTNELEMEIALTFNGGVRGTTVAIGRLDRDKEGHFQPKQKIDKISSLNNFEYSEDGSVVAHRQYDIGLGRVFHVEHVPDMSTNMMIERGYKESTSLDLTLNTCTNSRGMNYPCPEEACMHTFSSRDQLDAHLTCGNHLSGEAASGTECTEDKVKRSWLNGLSGKVAFRKSGIQKSLEGEILREFSSDSAMVPKVGWALQERTGSARLQGDAKAIVIEMFEAGRKNKNHRVSPQSAELKLRDTFPDREECWLTAKQIKGLFSRLAAGGDKDEDETDLFGDDYDNIEAAVILDEARLAIKKTINKKKNVTKKVKKAE